MTYDQNGEKLKVRVWTERRKRTRGGYQRRRREDNDKGKKEGKY